MRFERTHSRVSKQIQEQLTNQAVGANSGSVPVTASPLANNPLLHRTFRESSNQEDLNLANLAAIHERFQARKQPPAKSEN